MKSTTLSAGVQAPFCHIQRQVKPRARQLAAEEEADRQRLTDKHSGHVHTQAEQLVHWLEVLTEGYPVVEVLVKEIEVPSLDNRFSKFGYYDRKHLAELARHVLEFSGNATAIYFRANPVSEACLGRAANRLKKANRGENSSAKDVSHRRLLAIDIDPITPVNGVSATDAEKEYAHRKMIKVSKSLAKRGWPYPVVVDTGNGYHLLYRIDLPVDDGGLVHRCLKALDARFTDSTAKIDTLLHDPARMLKLPGTMACKGDPLPDRPHRMSRVLKIPHEGIRVVSRELLERLAAEAPAEQVQKTTGAATPAVLENARAYVAKIESGISGQHGSDPTFKAACKLVLGFGLKPEEALPLLKEYSQRCQPPWTDGELRHKLEDANKEPGQRGYLRQDYGEANDPYVFWEPLDGATFHGYVPDFADADADDVLGPFDCFADMMYFIFPVLFVLWRLLCSDVLVPDVWLAQCRWGGWRPQNWRRVLKKKMMVSATMAKRQAGSRGCQEPTCLFRGLAVRHQHYTFSPKRQWGLLEYFIGDEPPDLKDLPSDLDEHFWPERGSEHGEYRLYGEEMKKLRDYLRKRGRLIKAYWPALLFGGSRRVRWTPSQQRLLQGVVHELTRARNKKNAEAHVIRNGRVITAGKGGFTVKCDLLDPEQNYVVFGGNKRLWGRGYMIHGRTGKGWLYRAGYSDEAIRADLVGVLRAFLADLAQLAADLGIIVAGYHPKQKKWKGLDELRDSLSSRASRRWLWECNLRIFAPADWLIRWRYFFSQRMGVRWIPASADDPGPTRPETSVAPTPERITTPGGFRRWLEELGWSHKRLAEELHCSRQRVERHLAGKSTTTKFYDEVNQLRHTWTVSPTGRVRIT